MHARLYTLATLLFSALALLLAPAALANKPAFPKFEDTIKGMTATPGMLTLYRHNPDDKTKDHTKLLCRIPHTLLNQDMLFATSISRGQLAGFQWRDELVRFQVIGRQVVLAAPATQYVENPNNPLGDAIARTYRPRYLIALPIVTMAKKDPVVDLGALVFSSVASPPGPNAGRWGFSAARINRPLSTLKKVKSFPNNVLIDADLAMSAGPGFQAVGVSYAFRKLPKQNGYQPRPADERIGYFVTTRRDWTAPHTARDINQRYINRWHLTKQDPSLRLSPPKEPIVFVIEKTVPIRWRRWVRAGILEWNKAFEDIGFVDAIVVQQQTDTNEFANADPEDARYNFVRWIVTGAAFAMGPSRADPRTGQILDADIIIDDAILRAYTRRFDVYGPQAIAALAGPGSLNQLLQQPQLAATLFGPNAPTSAPQPADRHHPTPARPTPQSILDGPAFLGQPHKTPPPFTTSQTNPHHDHHKHTHHCHHDHHYGCSMAIGIQRQLMIGQLALIQARAAAGLKTPSGKDIPEELIGQVIKDLVSHEVGHTLGLRLLGFEAPEAPYLSMPHMVSSARFVQWT